MLREMSYREFLDWQRFYAQCGGYPHEVEDVRWARSVLVHASAPKGQPALKLQDFLMVNREYEATEQFEPGELTAPTQEAVDFIHRLAANG